jgi:hypothetical protein
MTDTSKIAEHIVDAFRYRDITPDAEFISASGVNHGAVEAWDIGDGKSVIAYGDNAVTHYDIDDRDAEGADLAAWLLTEGTGGHPLERAAVLGPYGISQVGADYVGDVAVIIHKQRYESCGNGDSYGCLTAEGFSADWDFAAIFTSAAEAAAAIKDLCPADAVYRLGYNEYARPSFYIVAA